MRIRTAIAVGAARLAGGLSRRLAAGGGSALPGVVGLKLDPRLVEHLAGRLAGRIVVTGTNGKTTTSRFIGNALTQAGHEPVHNQAGSNLLRGIASTLALDRSGRHRDRWGLFEVDEATMPAACRAVRPEVVVVTNLFRDQLDRYGELKRTAEYLRQGLAALPAGSTVVLNADDPLVASLGRGLRQRVVYFGIEDTSAGRPELPHAADSLSDPKTGRLLDYRKVFVGHLGHYRSPRGEWQRPKPDVAIIAVKLRGIAGSRLTIRHPDGTLDLTLAVPGLYNAYNALAAAAGGLAAGIPPAILRSAIMQTGAAFGRVERIPVGRKHLFIGLIKNPTGANELMTTLALERHKKDVLIIINDNFADGTDVSWLWDADFEQLVPHLRSVAVAGTRAADMAVRLKYAGLAESAVRTYRSIPEAVAGSLRKVPAGGTLYVLPTYTAMLALRRHLRTMGHVDHYLET